MATTNDIVLIYFEGQPLAFARIEDISPDARKDWYHVKLLILQVPLQVTTWILRDTYINGAEFTMNGKKMRLEKIVAPEEPENLSDMDSDTAKSDGQKIVSLAERKKKK